MNNYAFRMNFSRPGPGPSPSPSPKPNPKPVPLASNPNPNPNPTLIPVTREPLALLAPLAPLANQTDRFSMSRLINFKATGGCRSCS